MRGEINAKQLGPPAKSVEAGAQSGNGDGDKADEDKENGSEEKEVKEGHRATGLRTIKYFASRIWQKSSI